MFIDLSQMVSYTAVMLASADASAPQAIGAPMPDWAENARSLKRNFEHALTIPSVIKQGYAYKSDGTMGMPSLSVYSLVEFSTLRGTKAVEPQRAGIDLKGSKEIRHIVPKSIGLATKACFLLDYELTQKLGAWGPECKIVKFLKMPTKGEFVKQTDPKAHSGDYYYTPREPNTKDSVRFILENGAGKQVDVTINLDVSADSTDYTMLLDGATEYVGDAPLLKDTSMFASWSQPSDSSSDQRGQGDVGILRETALSTIPVYGEKAQMCSEVIGPNVNYNASNLGGHNVLTPELFAIHSILKLVREEPSGNPSKAYMEQYKRLLENVQVVVVSSPLRGKLLPVENDGYHGFFYMAEQRYFGRDKIVFSVKFSNGKTVLLTNEVSVVDTPMSGRFNLDAKRIDQPCSTTPTEYKEMRQKDFDDIKRRPKGSG